MNRSPRAPLSLLAVCLLATSSRGGLPAGFRLRRRTPEPAQARRVRPHVLVLGREGEPYTGGDFGRDEAEIRALFRKQIGPFLAGIPRKAIVIHAHGANNSLRAGLDMASRYRDLYMRKGIFPLTIAWRTDILTTLGNVVRSSLAGLPGRLRRASPRATESAVSQPASVDLQGRSRWESVAPRVGGRKYWRQLKQQASAASAPGGALRVVAEELIQLRQLFPDLEVHLDGTSAGTVMVTEFLGLLTGAVDPEVQVPVARVQLRAGAATLERFKGFARPALADGRLGKVHFWTLRPQEELADSIFPGYSGSVIEMVSWCMEERPDMPLVGLSRHLARDPEVQAWIQAGRARHVESPNQLPEDDPDACRAVNHVQFEQDAVHYRSLMQTVLRSLRQDQAD